MQKHAQQCSQSDSGLTLRAALAALAFQPENLPERYSALRGEERWAAVAEAMREAFAVVYGT